MKPIQNYILLVDTHRRPSRQRNTAGRYRVGAKSEKEAEKLLRNAIGFGSIHVYYTCETNKIGYKEIVKEIYNEETKNYDFETPKHTIAKQK